MNDEPSRTDIEEWIEIGTIVAPQGLYGEMRVYPNSDFPERFLVPGTRWLQHPDTGQIEAKELLGGRYLAGKNLYVIALKDIEYRDRAEALRDYKILVPKSERPELAEDEFHVQDLINLEVFDRQTGENIGIVTNVYYAGNNLLEVLLHKQPEQKEVNNRDLSKIDRRSKRKKYRPKKLKPVTILIPFVMEIVPVVDIANKKIEIDPPEGLLNI